jgi:hypothetical protein
MSWGHPSIFYWKLFILEIAFRSQIWFAEGYTIISEQKKTTSAQANRILKSHKKCPATVAGLSNSSSRGQWKSKENWSFPPVAVETRNFSSYRRRQKKKVTINSAVAPAQCIGLHL